MAMGTSGDNATLKKLLGTDWQTMVMKNITTEYAIEKTDKPHVQDTLFTRSWLMGALKKAVGPGVFTLKGMVSPDRWTMDSCKGYPEIGQAGETCNGKPIQDHQHPHKELMEMAALYELPINQDIAMHMYVAPVGEPALGPTAAPHARTAMYMVAPRSHHIQDSTHIAYMVLTAGLQIQQVWMIEASVFNGNEPRQDEFIGVDTPQSASLRLTHVFSPNLVGQVSYGHLGKIEAHEPETSVKRATASLEYSKTNPGMGVEEVSARSIVGYNHKSPGPDEQAFLLEGLARWPDWAMFGRYELVNRSAHGIDPLPHGPEEVHHERGLPDLHIESPTPIQQLQHFITVGMARRLMETSFGPIDAGVSATGFPGASDDAEFRVFLNWSDSPHRRVSTGTNTLED
jgi:hypothetical protein